MRNLFIYVLASISSIFAAVNLSLADVDLDSGTLSVNIDSDPVSYTHLTLPTSDLV